MTLVYILTAEPYHDNGWVAGVYLTEAEGVAALAAAPNPTDINCPDYRLTEWDMIGNRAVRRWDAVGRQVTDPTVKGWAPVRKDFIVCGPEDV